MSKLVIIGDSFCMKYRESKTRPNETYCFWVDLIKSNINNDKYEVILDAQPSRDAQTIMENWIKVIPHLTEDDFLVICFPSLKRTRLPFDEKDYTKVFSRDESLKLITRYVGTPSYDNSYQDLEFWKKNYNWKYFEDNLKFQEVINGSIAQQLNFIELIDSLSTLTKCRKFVFTWDDLENNSNNIYNKEEFTKMVGIWETFNDVYTETNGLCGEEDFHWSFKMNEIFSKFILEQL